MRWADLFVVTVLAVLIAASMALWIWLDAQDDFQVSSDIIGFLDRATFVAFGSLITVLGRLSQRT